MRFAGSDGHHAPAGGRRDSWTKFWLHGLVSLARIVTSPNHARAAATAQDIEPMQLTLDGDGRPTEVVALRWTDANPERVYRLQPFGGRMLEKGPFGGFTIPTRVELGNLYGTPDYAPFFLATITTAELGGSSR